MRTTSTTAMGLTVAILERCFYNLEGQELEKGLIDKKEATAGRAVGLQWLWQPCRWRIKMEGANLQRKKGVAQASDICLARQFLCNLYDLYPQLNNLIFCLDDHTRGLGSD